MRQDKLTTKFQQALAEALLRLLEPGDAVLVKGSRGMKLEEILQAEAACPDLPRLEQEAAQAAEKVLAGRALGKKQKRRED